MENKTMGLRQHHCRACGKAICDKCSSHKSPVPKLGFEFEVRLCDPCFNSLTETEYVLKLFYVNINKSFANNCLLTCLSSNFFSRQSLASFHEAKHSVTAVHLDESRNLLVTVGGDRLIKIWDVSALNQ